MTDVINRGLQKERWNSARVRQEARTRGHSGRGFFHDHDDRHSRSRSEFTDRLAVVDRSKSLIRSEGTVEIDGPRAQRRGGVIDVLAHETHASVAKQEMTPPVCSL